MSPSLYELSSPEVAEQLAKSRLAVLPFGSVEQHGPHLPCGTDTIAAELVARELAKRLGALYAPFGPYGVTPLHAGRPGTISLQRGTFEALVTDVCTELVGMGVSTLVFVNWHEVNTPSLNAVGNALQKSTGARVFVAQASHLAGSVYADQGGRLTHGGGIEALAVMSHDPDLVNLEKAGGALVPPGAADTDAMRRSREVYGFVTDIGDISPDGWYGDPGWATEERAATFPAAVVDAIVERLRVIGALEGHES